MAIQLSKPYFKTGRNVMCDNFFADLEFVEALAKNGLTLVDTKRTERIGII